MSKAKPFFFARTTARKTAATTTGRRHNNCCGAFTPPIPFSYQYYFGFFHANGQFQAGQCGNATSNWGRRAGPVSLAKVNFPAQKAIIGCTVNNVHSPTARCDNIAFADGHAKFISAAIRPADHSACSPPNFDWTIGGVAGTDTTQ